MIEREIVFALGFLTAGLLALACLPAVWRRALRLTTRRLTQLVPLSMDEIVAERDGLRAGFAVEQRRLEQKAEAVEGRRGDLMVRLGRRDATIATLEDAALLAAIRIADLTAELRETTRDLHEVRGETGTAAVALHDISGLAERRRWELLTAEEMIASLRSTIDENRATIASLETRIIGLDSRIADLDHGLGQARAELIRQVQSWEQVVAERDAAATALDALVADHSALESEAARLKDVAEEERHRAVTEAQAASAHRATIDEMRIERLGLDAQLAMHSEATRAATDRLSEFKAEKIAPAPVATVAEDTDLTVLRDALRQVSDAVLRLTEARDEPASKAAPAVGELSLPN